MKNPLDLKNWPTAESKMIAFRVLRNHSDCLRDDVNLDDLIDDIASELDTAVATGAEANMQLLLEALRNLANCADEFEADTATGERKPSNWQPALLEAIENAHAAIAKATGAA